MISFLESKKNLWYKISNLLLIRLIIFKMNDFLGLETMEFEYQIPASSNDGIGLNPMMDEKNNFISKLGRKLKLHNAEMTPIMRDLIRLMNFKYFHQYYSFCQMTYDELIDRLFERTPLVLFSSDCQQDDIHFNAITYLCVFLLWVEVGKTLRSISKIPNSENKWKCFQTLSFHSEFEITRGPDANALHITTFVYGESSTYTVEFTPRFYRPIVEEYFKE